MYYFLSLSKFLYITGGQYGILISHNKRISKTLSIDHTYSTQHIEQVDEKFYYRPSTTEEYNYAVIYEDESFTALIDGVSNELAVIIMNRNKEPICCITAQQIIPFLVKSYNELQSFITP